MPLGEGDHEQSMIKTVIELGYEGPVGILDHIPSQDAKVSLRKNIEGLRQVLATISRQDRSGQEK